jgi:hypothetical protein
LEHPGSLPSNPQNKKGAEAPFEFTNGASDAGAITMDRYGNAIYLTPMVLGVLASSCAAAVCKPGWSVPRERMDQASQTFRC